MKLKMKSPNQIVREALLKEIDYLKHFCNSAQILTLENNAKIYGGLKNLPEEKLKELLLEVQTIVNKNFKGK